MEKFKAVAYFTSGEIKEVELSRKDWFTEAKKLLGFKTADLGGNTIVEDITDEEKTIIAQSIRVFYVTPAGFMPILCGGENV